MDVNVLTCGNVGLPLLSCAHLPAWSPVVWPSSRVQGQTALNRQQLRRSRYHPLSSRRRHVVVANAHPFGYGPHGPHVPPQGPPPGHGPHFPTPDHEPLGSSIHFLDDISRYIYHKLHDVIAPRLPPDFDPLGWLPEGLHNKLHKGEAGAISVVREVLHFTFFYFAFSRVESFCRWLHRTNVVKVEGRTEGIKESYKTSGFRAMGNPLRFLIGVWAATRFVHISAPLFNVRLEHHVTAKFRATGFVLAMTWFVLEWKDVYVDKLSSNYRLDAPRIVAFDKIISLLVGFIAASCIGEVTGFGLRSLLAVGGFSGIALGLAAKEIVSNFFGGALLFITRPFIIGERIKAGQFIGHVQDIGFLNTKILSADRMPMVIPNQNFINQAITNYSRASNKLMEADFPLRPQDIFLVDRITDRIVTYLHSLPEVDPTQSTPLCYLSSLHAMELNLAVRCIVRASGGSAFYKVQQSILVHIADIIHSEGAWIAPNPPIPHKRSD